MEQARVRAQRRGLREVVVGATLRVFTDEVDLSPPAQDGDGLIIGVLFGGRTSTRRERPDWSGILASEGRALIEDAWGRFVALFVSRDGCPVALRDPSGGQPAYLCANDDYALMVSDPGLAADLGLLVPTIDWTFVAEELAFPGQRGQRTGIDDLVELAPGEAVKLVDQRWRHAALWSPWTFAARERQHRDPLLSARDLFDAVKLSARGLSSLYTALSLELSGGLDSSIMAAALTGHSGVHAVNGATAGAEGDERRYARAVADHCRLGIDYRKFEAGDVDLGLCSSPRGARPGRPSVLGGVNAMLWKHAQDHGSQAFFSGVGGDSVFCLLNSAAPLVDRLRTSVAPKPAWTTLRNLATVNDATLWAVSRQALRIARRPTLGPPQTADQSFLAIDTPPRPPLHRWLATAPRDALPGRFRHIASIAYIQGYMDAQTRGVGRPMIAPLLAQPVLEAVLATPTWFWVEGGRDRAVARRAFAGALPDLVLSRRSKGRIDRMVREVFELNRPVLKDLLLGGSLSDQRLVDLSAIETALSTPVDPRQRTFRRLMELADVEVWLRTWRR